MNDCLEFLHSSLGKSGINIEDCTVSQTLVVAIVLERNIMPAVLQQLKLVLKSSWLGT